MSHVINNTILALNVLKHSSVERDRKGPRQGKWVVWGKQTEMEFLHHGLERRR